MEGTRDELKRLEEELLAEEKRAEEDRMIEELIREQKAHNSQEEDYLDEALLQEILEENTTPAFEDPDKIYEPAEPMAFCNYSNDYGKELQTQQQPAKQVSDKTLIILMSIASVLGLGIIGVLAYWLITFG